MALRQERPPSRVLLLHRNSENVPVGSLTDWWWRRWPQGCQLRSIFLIYLDSSQARVTASPCPDRTDTCLRTLSQASALRL